MSSVSSGAEKTKLASAFKTKSATYLVLSICFSIMFSFLLVTKNLSVLLKTWSQEIQVVAYMVGGAEEEKVSEVKSFLEKENRIKAFKFIDKEVAQERFSKQMDTLAPELASDKGVLDLVPASFEIQIAPEFIEKFGERVFDTLASDLRGYSGVDEVSYGQDWILNFTSFSNLANSLGGAMGLALLACCLLVVAYTVRLSITSRRREIEILELIGASYWKIRKPFIAEGLLMGIISSVVALLLCYLGMLGLKEILSGYAQAIGAYDFVVFYSPFEIAQIVVLSSFVTGGVAFLVSKMINSGWAAASDV
jgi:cell division transport system permease protein